MTAVRRRRHDLKPPSHFVPAIPAPGHHRSHLCVTLKQTLCLTRFPSVSYFNNDCTSAAAGCLAALSYNTAELRPVAANTLLAALC